MIEDKRRNLATKFLVCTHTLKNLLEQIKDIELDMQMSSDDKHSKIKIIRLELSKVETEIDNIKKEITLLNSYNVN